MITIAYITNRREPHIQWFRDSLERQLDAGRPKGNFHPPAPWDDIQVIVVDRLRDERPLNLPVTWIHAVPKPCVWQGRGRLTDRDWFAAANARNTALCLCNTDWIVYVDDLSVLWPSWLPAVREAKAKNYIALGAYRKVKLLRVSLGEVKSFQEYAPGLDSRWSNGQNGYAVPCPGSWLYGCSVAMPVEALLKVNGWPEEADGLGSEDYLTGIAIAKHGYDFRYDRRMCTLESEEDHHTGEVLVRRDKGTSPSDKSHAIIDRYAGVHSFRQWFGSVRELRDAVLAGHPFPEATGPTHDWYDQQPIAEMKP